MAEIIAFPNANERDWREMEALFRENYKDMPDGPATLEECLPAIRQHWQDIFVSFSIQPSYQIPGPLREDQVSAIKAAVDTGVNLMAEYLKSERSRLFGMLVACEWKAAYFHRNGTAV
jgi:hypothetical protein